MYSSAEPIITGLWLYKNAFSDPARMISRLEQNIQESNNVYTWKQSLVGRNKKNTQYRDCFDFKIKKVENDSLIENKNKKEFQEIWNDCYSSQLPAVEDYSIRHGIQLNYWEAFNFIKYGKDQHFQEHSDHGYSYVSVLSSVGYLNDDYEGGELYFPKFNLKIKPEAGDLYLFPSSFIYSHVAMPVKNGTKYSVVTMLDYNDFSHGGSNVR